MIIRMLNEFEFIFIICTLIVAGLGGLAGAFLRIIKIIEELNKKH